MARTRNARTTAPTATPVTAPTARAPRTPRTPVAPVVTVAPVVALTDDEMVAARHADYMARGVLAAATARASALVDDVATCRTCNESLPIRKFPTTRRDADGVLGRATQCRACRDANVVHRAPVVAPVVAPVPTAPRRRRAA